MTPEKDNLHSMSERLKEKLDCPQNIVPNISVESLVS
jgi:hypothetical protein